MTMIDTRPEAERSEAVTAPDTTARDTGILAGIAGAIGLVLVASTAAFGLPGLVMPALALVPLMMGALVFFAKP